MVRITQWLAVSLSTAILVAAAMSFAQVPFQPYFDAASSGGAGGFPLTGSLGTSCAETADGVFQCSDSGGNAFVEINADSSGEAYIDLLEVAFGGVRLKTTGNRELSILDDDGSSDGELILQTYKTHTGGGYVMPLLSKITGNGVDGGFLVEKDDGTDHLAMDGSGNVSLIGTLTSSGTGNVGWSVQSAGNQACDTTCTSACVVGQDTDLAGVLVGCASATADVCLCAGAS